MQLTFRQLIDNAGIGAGAPSRRAARLEAYLSVRTLLGWYRAGEDVQSRFPALSTYLGHRGTGVTYWYLSAAPELCAGRRPAGHRVVGGTVMTLIAPLQAFFTDRLPAASGQPADHRVLPRHPAPAAHLRAPAHRKMPAQLDWDDLDAITISAFLNHLEQRRNSTRTRNLRLTAIRSLFSYAALRHEHALLIQRVLAIPRNGSTSGS